MALAKKRRLIVNADDFGRSSSINSAVIDAHRRGILTTASLMVNGDAAREAVRLAHDNPRLGVGLHLTLCDGKAATDVYRIARLVNGRGEFRKSAFLAGIIYFFSMRARRELALEIRNQMVKFAETGLLLDHLNGHLHFHLHPVVFDLLGVEVREGRVRAMRLTHDPVSIDWALGSGRWLYRSSHALIFNILARRSSPFLRASRTAHTQHVFGLLESGRMTEGYLLNLLPRLPAGDSEVYSHPCAECFQDELSALLSQRVKAAIQAAGIELIRYQDLWQN